MSEDNTIDESQEHLDTSRNTVAVVFDLEDETQGQHQEQEKHEEISEDEAREKISVWAGGLLAGAFVFLHKKMKITKEQCANLGGAWGTVVGKWYPTTWINRTEQAGDVVSSFEPEKNAIMTTFNIFGDRVLGNNPKNSPENKQAVPENSPENPQEIPENPQDSGKSGEIGFPPTLTIGGE